MWWNVDKSTIYTINPRSPDRPDRFKNSGLTVPDRTGLSPTVTFHQKNPRIPLGHAGMRKESVALVGAVDLLGQVIGDSIVGGRHGFVTFLPIHWANFTIFFEVL